MNRKELKRRQRRKGRWRRLSFLVLAFIVVAGGVYLYTIFHDVRSTVDHELHQEISSINTTESGEKVDQKEPINLLLLGVDERKNDVGRSDTMIVMNLDPNNNQMQMVSIPRDTRAKIVGDGRVTRINHSYAYGGSDMAVDTVEKFLDIKVDYYVRVNMEGLSQLVNAVDGVTVQNDIAFSSGGYNFEKGELHFNGKEALAFVRMRKGDPKGDLGRNERQRQVIQGLIEKGSQLNVLNKIDDVMNVLGDNVNTNMQFEDMRRLVMNYRSAREEVSTYQMSGEGVRRNGMYLIIMPDGEIQKTHNKIVNFGF